MRNHQRALDEIRSVLDEIQRDLNVRNTAQSASKLHGAIMMAVELLETIEAAEGIPTSNKRWAWVDVEGPQPVHPDE